jgi:antitoxin ParD1/3/4
MNVTLTPELEQLVDLKVRTGGYASPSEVVQDALRLLEERDRALALRRDDIRQMIGAGMTSLREGKGVDGDSYLAAMDAEISRGCSQHGRPEPERASLQARAAFETS